MTIPRPRLTPTELLFLAKALRQYETYCKSQRANLDQRETTVKRLKQEWIATGDMNKLKQWQQEQAQLNMDRQQRQTYWREETAAQHLAKRLEALVNGGRLHSNQHTRIWLKPLLIPTTILNQ